MTSVSYEQSANNPFPIKLGDLKEPLQADAAENQSSLHGWIRAILTDYVRDNIGNHRSDLRLGNLIYFFNNGQKPVQVESMVLVDGKYEINGAPVGKVKAIVLTKEILNKCGFKVMDGRFTMEGASFYLLSDPKCFLVKSWHGSLISKIRFVHQLQNLYSSMTGEELIIRL
jgi:hypothetical protein